MKKGFVLFIILVLIAGTLSAEISFITSADMVLTPFQYIINNDDTPRRFNEPEFEDVVMGAGAGRFASGQGPRARLDMRGSWDDTIGMRARIQVRTDGIGVEDYLHVWWKPTDWIRLDAGRFFDDRFRGNINDLDERMSAYTVRMYDGDAIFSRFRTHWVGQAGMMLGFEPPMVENLWVGAMLYGLNPFSVSPAAGTVYDGRPDFINDNADAWRRIQVAAGYKIEDVGLFRVQYFGAKPLVDIRLITDETALLPATFRMELFNITAPKIEAAFAYTQIKGLTIDIGGKYPLPFKEWTRTPSNIFEKEEEALILDILYKIYKNDFIWQAPYQASLGVKFKKDDTRIGFGGRVDTKFFGKIEGHNMERHLPLEINAHIWPSYNFDFARLILNAGIEYIGPTYNKNKEIIGLGEPRALNGGYRIGAGISLEKTFNEGSLIKFGVAYKLPGEVNGLMEKAVISIPLFFEFTFREIKVSDNRTSENTVMENEI